MSVGSSAEGEGELVPAGCCNYQIRMRRRSSLRQSGNPGDTHLGHRGASRHALPTKKRVYDEPRYDTNERSTEPTLGDHERMTARERVDIQEGEACVEHKRPSTLQEMTDRLTISPSRRA